MHNGYKPDQSLTNRINTTHKHVPSYYLSRAYLKQNEYLVRILQNECLQYITVIFIIKPYCWELGTELHKHEYFLSLVYCQGNLLNLCNLSVIDA